MSKQLRIDNLAPGSFVEVDFNGRYTERCVFLYIKGEGDDREAVFTFPSAFGDEGEWRMLEIEAYRYNGRWAFGSSAEPLRLLEVFA